MACEGMSTNGKQLKSWRETYFDLPTRTTAPQTAELQSFSSMNQKQ